jgi:hypothetical protein
MSKDVSVEFRGEEVVITKHNDSREATETVEALRRAVEFFNKNTDEMTAGAYGPGDDDEEDDEDEREAERSQRERERRRRQLAERVAERGRLEATNKLLKGIAMIDTDALVEKIDNNLIELAAKQGCGIAVLKAYVEEDRYRWCERQVTKILTDAWGKDFAKNLQSQTPEGLTARQALEKARNAQWLAAYKAAPLTGERALAVTVNPRVERDPVRERIVTDKRNAAPWMSEEELDRYATEMKVALERAARGKQERSRPGTLERA